MAKTFYKETVDKLFKEYHKDNIETATHLIVYSKTQEERIDMIPSWEKKRLAKPHYKSKRYTEMRSRDSELMFADDDAVLLGVGRTEDIEFK